MHTRIRHFLLGVSTLVLVAACATAPKPATTASASTGPGDFHVVNPTLCYARISAVNAGSAGGNVFVNDSYELAMVGPGQKGTVTVPANRRLGVVMYTTPTPDPNQPGADCRRSGTVSVTPVAAGT